MAVSLIFDIVIAVLCIILIVRYSIRGFIKSLMTLVKTLLAPFMAVVFNMPLARVFASNVFMGMSQDWVRSMLISTETASGKYALYSIVDGIPNSFINYVLSSGLDEETTNKINLYFGTEEKLATMAEVDYFTEVFGGQLSLLISMVVAFIVIFVVAEIIFIIVGALLNKLCNRSILKVINIILGGLIGAIIAATVASVIVFVVVKVFEFGGNYYENIFKQEYIENTVLFEFFKDNSIWSLVKRYIAIK